MKFFEAFLQVGLVVFAFPLVGSCVTQMIGEPTGSNYKDKGHNILTTVACAALILSIFWLSNQIGDSLFILLPAFLLVVFASSFRLNYEDGYDISRFTKTSLIKLTIAVALGFFISAGK